MQARQFTLDLGRDPAFSRDDLIVSTANSHAVGFLESWDAVPPALVVLAGPPGSGKTHLASVWRSETGAALIDRRSVDAEAVTIAEARATVIDDADAGDLDEAGLFHLLNASRAAGQPVLLAARRFPSAWGVKLPDLASRLKAATTIELLEPDDTLLTGVIAKLFSDRQVEVDPQVIQYLVRRIERSVATAIAVVERLDRRALETKSRITRQLASGVLDAMEAGQDRLGF